MHYAGEIRPRGPPVHVPSALGTTPILFSIHCLRRFLSLRFFVSSLFIIPFRTASLFYRRAFPEVLAYGLRSTRYRASICARSQRHTTSASESCVPAQPSIPSSSRTIPRWHLIQSVFCTQDNLRLQDTAAAPVVAVDPAVATSSWIYSLLPSKAR